MRSLNTSQAIANSTLTVMMKISLILAPLFNISSVNKELALWRIVHMPVGQGLEWHFEATRDKCGRIGIMIEVLCLY